jgi:hypothetical protein
MCAFCSRRCRWWYSGGVDGRPVRRAPTPRRGVAPAAKARRFWSARLRGASLSRAGPRDCLRHCSICSWCTATACRWAPRRSDWVCWRWLLEGTSTAVPPFLLWFAAFLVWALAPRHGNGRGPLARASGRSSARSGSLRSSSAMRRARRSSGASCSWGGWRCSRCSRSAVRS